MKKNSVLKVAAIGIKSAIGLIILGTIVLIVIMIHSHFNPEPYEKMRVSTERGRVLFEYEANSLVAPPTTYEAYKSSKNQNFYLSRLEVHSKLHITLRLIVGTVLTVLALYYIYLFVSSSRQYATFFENNAIHFRKLGILFIVGGFIAFLLSFIPMELTMIFPENKFVSHRSSGIHLFFIMMSIGLAVLSFIASAVFSEGAKLREENNLTV